jgi:hypothetical protein
MASFFIFIARVIGSAHAGGPFAELEAISSDSIARLKERACNKFKRWGVDADEVELFLAAEGGDDAPSPESIEALLTDPTKRLGEAWSLERARIGPGSWLLARVPPPPAAAGGWKGFLGSFWRPRSDPVVLALVERIERQGSELQGLRETTDEILRRTADDDSLTVLSDAQYESRARKFLSSELLRRCGLEVVAGIDVSRTNLLGMQWDFRAPVTIAMTEPHPNAETNRFEIYPSKPYYSRPPRIAAREVTPTKFNGAPQPPAANYFALFEITTAEKWSERYRERRDTVSKTMLTRIEERLRLTLERARAEGFVEGTQGILDLVAVVGVVAPKTCTESVSHKMSKENAPVLLKTVMDAGRFVVLVMSLSGG